MAGNGSRAGSARGNGGTVSSKPEGRFMVRGDGQVSYRSRAVGGTWTADRETGRVRLVDSASRSPDSRYSRMSEQELGRMLERSRQDLLSAQQVKRRLQVKRSTEQQERRVLDWLADDTKVAQGQMSKRAYNRKWKTNYGAATEPPAVMPGKASYRAMTSLQRHLEAKRFLRWYGKRNG